MQKNATPTRKYPTFVFVGRLSILKGVDTLYKAFALVLEDYPQARLLMVGSGPIRADNCLDKDTAARVEGHVEYVGEVPHDRVRHYYRMADFFVLPSRLEGVPRVVIEAWASGVPVIATAVGAIPELLANGRGRIVKPDDFRELARQMKILASSPKSANAIRDAASAFFASEYATDQWRVTLDNAISIALRRSARRGRK